MALEYVLPQVKVFQQYAQLPLTIQQSQNAFVFGESYTLWRYANKDVKPLLLKGRYKQSGEWDADMTYPQDTAGNPDIDLDYVKVFVDNASVVYATNGKIAETSTNNELILTQDMSFASPNPSIANAAGVQVGDTVWFNVDPDYEEYAIVREVRYVPGVGYTKIIIDRDKSVTADDDVEFSRNFNSVQVDTTVVNTEKVSTEFKFSFGTQTATVIEGDVYIEYRTKNNGNGIIDEVRTHESVLADVGFDIHPDDPLTFGVYLAVLNGGGKSVYYMAVEKDDWLGVLNQASNISGPYGLAPLTDDLSIVELIKSHVNTASTETSKRWRIAFVASDRPSRKYLMDEVDGLSASYDDKVVTFTSANPEDINAWDLVAGDRIDLYDNADNVTCTLGITTVSAPNIVNVEVVSGSAPVNTAYVTAKVYKVANPKIESDIIRDRSMGMHSRRLYHVYGGKNVRAALPTGGSQSVEPYFLTAAVAGLCGSVPPQQGLTNIELTGITGVPDMYKTYSAEQLDNMASGGTLLITQDMSNGSVYVRHQLSTARIDGNLNTTELSLIKNLDSISYFFAAQFKNMIGITNINDDTLAIIRTRLQDGIDYLSSNTSIQDANQGGFSIGPQLKAENSVINYVEVDPMFADTVNADIDLDLPKPFNVFNLVLRAI